MQSSFAFLTAAAGRSYSTLSQSTGHHEAFPTLKFKNIPLESLSKLGLSFCDRYRDEWIKKWISKTECYNFV